MKTEKRVSFRTLTICALLLVAVGTVAATETTVATSVPLGTIEAFAGAQPPHGWHLCDGAQVPRTLALFPVLGIAWGPGDGITTFNLPDLRGRCLVGTGTGLGLTERHLGDEGGEESHKLTVAEMPSHTHSYMAPKSTGTYDGHSSPLDNEITPAETSPAGGDQPHNNMQPFAAVNFIIRVQ
jgi:microcystin-dependent protein